MQVRHGEDVIASLRACSAPQQAGQTATPPDFDTPSQLIPSGTGQLDAHVRDAVQPASTPEGTDPSGCRSKSQQTIEQHRTAAAEQCLCCRCCCQPDGPRGMLNESQDSDAACRRCMVPPADTIQSGAGQVSAPTSKTPLEPVPAHPEHVSAADDDPASDERLRNRSRQTQRNGGCAPRLASEVSGGRKSMRSASRRQSTMPLATVKGGSAQSPPKQAARSTNSDIQSVGVDSRAGRITAPAGDAVGMPWAAMDRRRSVIAPRRHTSPAFRASQCAAVLNRRTNKASTTLRGVGVLPRTSDGWDGGSGNPKLQVRRSSDVLAGDRQRHRVAGVVTSAHPARPLPRGLQAASSPAASKSGSRRVSASPAEQVAITSQQGRCAVAHPTLS